MYDVKITLSDELRAALSQARDGLLGDVLNLEKQPTNRDSVQVKNLRKNVALITSFLEETKVS